MIKPYGTELQAATTELEGDSLLRWRRWTMPRFLLMVVWIGGTAVAVFIMTIWAWFIESQNAAPGFGEPHHPATLPLVVVLTALIGASGPLAIWVLRRTRPWLVATLVPIALTAASAMTTHPAEAVQQEIDRVPVPEEWTFHRGDVGGAGAPLFGEKHNITRIFSSTDTPSSTCSKAQEVLAQWATDEEVKAVPLGESVVLQCSHYVARSGVFTRLDVYDLQGWGTHARATDATVTIPDGAQTMIKLLVSHSYP